jgi:hypothetical protein
MPRRSAVEADFMHLMPAADRPEPPPDLPDAQAVIWKKTVNSMRATWFTPECHDLLRRYCFCMSESARLEAELGRVGPGLPSYDRIAVRYSEMSKLALSYGRALRLTPRANKESTADGREAQTVRDHGTTEIRNVGSNRRHRSRHR